MFPVPFIRRSIAIALLAWALPSAVDGGMLVPGEETWDDLVEMANSELVQDVAGSPSDAPDPENNYDARLNPPLERTSNSGPSLQIDTNASGGPLVQLVGGDPRRYVSLMPNDRRSDVYRAGVFRPPRGTEESLLFFVFSIISDQFQGPRNVAYKAIGF